MCFTGESPVITDEMQNEAQVRVQGFKPLPSTCVSPALHGLRLARCHIMSTSQQRGKGKAPMTDATAQGAESDKEKRIDQLRFGLNKMKNSYVQCKEKRSITVEARFEVNSFKDNFPNIYDQFQIRDWESFPIPLDPYFPELVGSCMPLTGHNRTS
ncbi:hypothetical protein HAX54_038020 [Datura stramonium]|uniref:Uncharacterized protein n=1 Tax=Datura stramonium TaxID=4076 RepID=A0ABS8VJY7_DATST|nr:hypothetical protein [Datura stramonium]